MVFLFARGLYCGRNRQEIHASRDNPGQPGFTGSRNRVSLFGPDQSDRVRDHPAVRLDGAFYLHKLSFLDLASGQSVELCLFIGYNHRRSQHSETTVRPHFLDMENHGHPMMIAGKHRETWYDSLRGSMDSRFRGNDGRDEGGNDGWVEGGMADGLR